MPWTPLLNLVKPSNRLTMYATKVYIGRDGRTPDCPGRSDSATGHSDTCKMQVQCILEQVDGAAASTAVVAEAAGVSPVEGSGSGPT